MASAAAAVELTVDLEAQTVEDADGARASRSSSTRTTGSACSRASTRSALTLACADAIAAYEADAAARRHARRV